MQGLAPRIGRGIVEIVTSPPHDNREVPEGADPESYERCLSVARRAFGRKKRRSIATLLAPFAVIHDLKTVKPPSRITSRPPTHIVFMREVRTTRFVSVGIALRSAVCVEPFLSHVRRRLLPVAERALGSEQSAQMELLASVVSETTDMVVRDGCGIGIAQHPLADDLLIWKQREALATTIKYSLIAACAFTLAGRKEDFGPLLASFRSGNPPLGFDSKSRLLRYAILARR